MRVGTYNFERINYKLYSDGIARLEAFKAGEYDALVEKSRATGCAATSARVRQRRADQARVSATNGTGMQGFILNLRRPLFSDVRVRKALDLALDFQWLNRQLFYSQYKRIDSFFVNTDLQARACRARRTRAARTMARTSSTRRVRRAAEAARHRPARFAARESVQARQLLAQAGWTYRDGALRNAKGEPFVFEILDDSGRRRVDGAGRRRVYPQSEEARHRLQFPRGRLCACTRSASTRSTST